MGEISVTAGINPHAAGMTVQPTMNLRWVDKSTNPQLRTEKVLQQMFHTSRGVMWCDVLDAGHISQCP